MADGICLQTLNMARDLPSRFRFRAVAGAIDAPHGCPPLHHDSAACGRTEAA